MFRKKATLITVRSLASLNKACSSRQQPSHISTTLASLNHLSTLSVNERVDLHDSSYGYDAPNASVNDGLQDRCGYSHEYPRPGELEGVYGKNLSTSAYKQNQIENNQYYTETRNLSFPGGYGIDYATEDQHKLDGQSGGSVGSHSEANSVSQNYTQYGGSVVRNNTQGEPAVDIGRFNTLNYHGEVSGTAPQNLSNYGVGNAGSLGSNMANFKDPSLLAAGIGHYVGNMGQTVPALNDQYAGKDMIRAQQSVDPKSLNTETQQHFTGHSNVSYTTQQTYGTNQSGNNLFYQQNSGGFYMGNTGMYQPSPSGHQSLTASGSWSNQRQSSAVASHALGGVTTEGESTENNASQVTLEQLDAFCNDEKVKEAVEVLGQLEDQSMSVDLPRYLALMNVCGNEKALEEAKKVHAFLLRSTSALKVSTYNRILEMYGRCGSMDDASDVFSKMPQRNLTTWDTMITWYSRNGLGEDAIDIFSRFKEGGLKPDGQMFLGVFAACAAVNDINEGMLHFARMSKDYGIVPSMKHYVGIVDMLGSTGYLDEALEFIGKMPVEPSVEVWETLMNLSRIHGNLELGDRCAQIVEQMDPDRLTKESRDGLLPIKASELVKDKRKSAKNFLEMKSRVHEYRAGDRSHPENDKIYALLRCMKEQMREAGYLPETRFVLHDIDPEGKEEALMAHSERLAVAYALMTSSARSPIRVIKNLRVCVDCHNALKIISKLVGRELIMRDAKRFHHMKDGRCSCNDYW